MGNYFNDMSGWGFGFGWIFQIIFWGLVIWAILALVRGGWGRGHDCGCGHDHGHGEHKKEDSALDILKERYAKGEINKEDFEQNKKDLVS